MLTLQMAVSDFLLHCQFEKNLSDKTLKAYRIDLSQLLKLFNEKKLPVNMADITKFDLREFLISLSNLKPASIKRKMAAVKALFNYLEFDDKLLINPFRKMRLNIREPKKLPKVMDIKEVTGMFKLAYANNLRCVNLDSYDHFECLRNVIVIELLFATGARVSEIAHLKTDCINLQTGNILIKGKGNKERALQICNVESIAILKQYQRLYRSKMEAAGDYFLVNRFGKRLSDQSIRAIVKKLAIKSGIKKHVTPHMFRHSFATLLLEKDVDIKYIQSLLGHSSIMTTQIYTHVNREKQRQILKTKHPRRDFMMKVQDE
jgi:integrase/recombinase XerD